MADNYNNLGPADPESKPKVNRAAESLFSSDEPRVQRRPAPEGKSASPSRERRPSQDGAVRRPAAEGVRRPSQDGAARRPAAQQAQRRPVNGAARPSSERSANGVIRPANRNGQRRPSSANASGMAAQHKKKKKNNFKKLLTVYAAIWVVILIVGAIIFSSYLGAYEKSQPSNEASQIVKSFSSADGLDKLLRENADKTDVIGDKEAIFSSYESSVVGKQISYVQNSDFRQDAPSYNITADGKVVAQVVLESHGSTGFGFNGWDIGRLSIAKYIPDITKYTVLVPQGSSVYLNGQPLDASYIVDSGVPRVLANVTQYLKEIPYYDTYSVPSMSEPSITAKDASGNEIPLIKSDTTFSATTTDQAFIDEVYPNTEATLDTYAKYFIFESHNLSAYMLPGTPAYVAIFGDDENYGIDTSLYNYEHIVDYGFDEKEIKNFVKYTDDCYTVDVKYHMYVNFDEDRFSDNDQALDATWVFVYDHNKNDWFLADSQSH